MISLGQTNKILCDMPNLYQTCRMVLTNEKNKFLENNSMNNIIDNHKITRLNFLKDKKNDAHNVNLVGINQENSSINNRYLDLMLKKIKENPITLIARNKIKNSYDNKWSNSNKNTKRFNDSIKNTTDFISTKASNLISTNYKSKIISDKINNKQKNVFNENINEKKDNIKNRVTKSNDFQNIKNNKLKKNEILDKNINYIINNIYNYNEQDKGILSHISQNNSLTKPNHDNINNENNQKKIKLSLMERYLISTDYSMNLTYKMR